MSLSITLQEIYDTALPGNGYDKYIILEPDNIYTGNIGIFEGSVFIGGAVIIIGVMMVVFNQNS